jgi:SAM-dependent methyltransferase
MRSDWDRRAREDARYYAAFGRREQEEAEFQQSAGDVVRNLDRELGRLPLRTDRAALRALEIGCGPGRVMLPMSLRFGEIHGVDISEEMIRLARERLASAPNAHVQATSARSRTTGSISSTPTPSSSTSPAWRSCSATCAKLTAC